MDKPSLEPRRKSHIDQGEDNEILIFEINDRIGPIDRFIAYTEPLENFLSLGSCP